MTMQLLWGFAVCKIFFGVGSTALPGTSASRLEKVVTSCSLGEKKNPQNYEKYCKKKLKRLAYKIMKILKMF